MNGSPLGPQLFNEAGDERLYLAVAFLPALRLQLSYTRLDDGADMEIALMAIVR